MSKDYPPAVQVVQLRGDHYLMGYQHGQQVKPLRPAIIKAIETRLAQIAQDNPDESFERLVRKTRQVVRQVDPAIVSFIRGQADSLGFDFDWLFRYSLVNFLRDALATPQKPASDSTSDKIGVEGCTTWAARGSATAAGQPLLVKNRDYFLEHLPLQIVVRAESANGYGCLYVTSAGNPGVFVAGLNEMGLAVADTHVPCPDVGPGLPTYALSMHILEEHSTVESALAYLQSIPRLGRNNLVLADAAGQIAVFENSHHHWAVLKAEGDYVIATNHFNSAIMKDCLIETEPPSLQGNTWWRYQKIKDVLTRAYGQIDIELAKRLMASHDNKLAAICRHPLPESKTSTISTIILLPVPRQMLFHHGPSCQGAYESFIL